MTVAGVSVTEHSDSSGALTFQLKDSESMQIYLPTGISYTIVETDYSSDNYSASFTVNNGTSQQGRNCTGILDDATTVTFSNYRPPIAPTGYHANTAPFVLMLVIGALLGVGTFLNRRKREED